MVNGSDIHPEDAKARLRKQFGTLSRFERLFSLERNTVSAGLRRPYEDVERAVSAAFGESLPALWPSRYHADGSRRRPQPARNYNYSRGLAA